MAQGTRPSLEVEQRDERGTRATKRLRQEGWVPGVVYGGEDCVSFKVNNRVLRAALVDGSALIDLKIGGGKARPVIIKDQQRHPVRGHVMHIDLLEGVEDAPGVKEGGVLEHVTRELNIEALPTDIPERITVDVSGMEVAATMHLSEVSAPPGVAFLDDPEETIIATITVPTEVVEPEIEEETELVGEEGVTAEEVEAEAGAEGATGDEAEGAAEAAAERSGEES
jgi:large subunit ribosomal protein L25